MSEGSSPHAAAAGDTPRSPRSPRSPRVRHPSGDVGLQEALQPGLYRLQAEAQGLRQLLHAWKRLLGLTACARLPELAADVRLKPSATRRAWPAFWLAAFVSLALGGAGLQWARCQDAYLSSSTPPDGHHNKTAAEYICQHSFVWTHLLPRLVYLFGYVVVFVCWFCLRHGDLIWVIKEAHDTVADPVEYPAVTEQLRRCCRRDRRQLAALFVAVVLLSVAGTLIGDGVIQDAGLFVTSTKQGIIIIASEVFNFFVNLVMDNVMFFGLVTYTMSLKYFHMMLLKTQTHLGSVQEQAHMSSDGYIRPQYRKGHAMMMQAQTYISAVLLLVLLRVCQGVTLIALDLTSRHTHTQSLGLLPIILVYTGLVYHLIYKCCRLSAAGLAHHARHLSTGPDFAKGGTPDTDEPGDDTTDEAAPLTAPQPGPSASSPPPPLLVGGRTADQWTSALQTCPAITGRLFGRVAARWMYAVPPVVALCYCSGYYTLERYWNLL